jgi:hypothetical protein
LDTLRSRTQSHITEDNLEGVEVIAEEGFQNVSSGIDPGLLVGNNTADLDDHRRILGKEARFDETVLERESQTHAGQAREEAYTPGMAYNPCCGRLQTGLRRSRCAARIGCGRRS